MLSHWAHTKPLSTELQEAATVTRRMKSVCKHYTKKRLLIKSNHQWKTGDQDLDLTGGALATLKFSNWTPVFIHVSAIPRFSLILQHFLFSRGRQINQLRHQTSLQSEGADDLNLVVKFHFPRTESSPLLDSSSPPSLVNHYLRVTTKPFLSCFVFCRVCLSVKLGQHLLYICKISHSGDQSMLIHNRPSWFIFIAVKYSTVYNTIHFPLFCLHHSQIFSITLTLPWTTLHMFPVSMCKDFSKICA